MTSGHTSLGKQDYYSILKYINKNYTNYCVDWLSKVENKLNLKKLQIRDIYTSDITQSQGVPIEFEKYMYSFMKGLDSLYMDILFDIESLVNLSDKVKFIGRVKKQESIADKIYRKTKEQGGTFPVNKYLNDLLGFRVIDPSYKNNIHIIKELVNSYNENNVSIMGKFRQNNGYEGYHIYLKHSNNTFPIEVQIWDKDKEHSNMQHHKVYKQEYLESIIGSYNKF
ncbi:hypothetical protein [Clostridium tertium]|jgi:ppGpp synthetase/RelA/SpoT-type nucleotidyltranferase|uniref:hypothetical protein n=1 Tax=Clostridium tertium TaxID=1559 RepID=UPI003333C954